jgi:hypothetical protein
MWNRTCPLCFVRVPRKLVLTRGDDLVCPSCHAPLEISRASRVLGSAAGLAAGYLGAQAIPLSAMGGWSLQLVGALFGYGIGAALVLFFISDVVVQPKAAVRDFPQSHR